MEWIRWATSSSDYKSTSEFLSMLSVQNVLKNKGYEVVPEKLFIFDDLMSFISLNQGKYENAHAIRLLPDKNLKIYKLVKSKDESKPRLFQYTYKNFNQIPSCGDFKKIISRYKTIRDLYMKAFNSYQSNSLGFAFIYLEAIAKLNKNLEVDIIGAQRNYNSLLETLNFKINDLKKDNSANVNFADKLSLVRNHLLMSSLNSYSRSQTSIIDALKSNSANCVGNTALFIALVNDLGINLDHGFEYGAEIFTDHVQFVIVNKEKNINWDVLSNTIDQVFDTPILKAKSFARSALIQSKVSLYSEDQINLRPIDNSDFLFITTKLNQPLKITPDQLNTSNTDESSKEELQKRIDIFKYDYDYQMSTFSNQEVPESASNSHLISKELTSSSSDLLEVFSILGIKLNLSDANSSNEENKPKKIEFLKLSDIGLEMYDEEALRVYTEVIRQQRYTPESISKYGYQHIIKYFPANHPFQDLVNKEAMDPLKLRKELNNPDANIILNKEGRSIVYYTTNNLEFYKTISYIDRFHTFFQSLISPYRSFKEKLAPNLILKLQQNVSLEEIFRIIQNLEIEKKYKDCHNSFFIDSRDSNNQCMEFFDHNTTGLKETRDLLATALKSYYLNKLKNPDLFIQELNKMSGEDLKLAIDSLWKLEYSILYKGTIKYGHLFNWTLSHLLRNPNFFYTSEPSEEELQYEKDLTNYAEGSQTFNIENSPIAKVNLPQVIGLPECSLWSGGGNTLCSISKSKSSEAEQKIVRKVVILKPHVLANLLIQDYYSFRPDDLLFLQLNWKTSNLKSFFEMCKNCKIPKSLSSEFYRKTFENLEIGYSEKDKQGELNTCRQQSSMKSYSECYFNISKKRFSKQVNLMEPSWITEDQILKTVRNHVRQMFVMGKFDEYKLNEVRDLKNQFFVAETYNSLPIEDLLSNLELDNLVLAQRDIEGKNKQAVQNRLNHVLKTYNLDKDQFNKLSFSYSRAVRNNLATYFFESASLTNFNYNLRSFLRRNKVYISGEYTEITNNNRTYIVPHIDPLKAIDSLVDFKTNYPELYELEQTLL